MNRRTIPFGYKFENGAVVVEDSAADIVKEIFNRYLAGDSMLNISELLNKLHVEYTPGITGWNKARIKRILEKKSTSAMRIFLQLLTKISLFAPMK